MSENNQSFDLIGAVKQLHKGLCDANAAFATQRLEGQKRTLWALYFFLDELELDPALVAPLLSIICDLEDSKRAGAEKPIADRTYMLFAAVTLDALVRTGMGMDDAARKVVKVAQKSGVDLSKGKLITYRKFLQRREQADSNAVRRYRELSSLSEKGWAHLSKEEQIKEALFSLRQVIESFTQPSLHHRV